MNEKLAIRNLGPVKEANLDLRDLTVFVGPQATGKSLAAQSLYFLRRFETLTPHDSDMPAEAALSALEWWFGKELSVYVGSDTKLYWNPAEPGKETASDIQWHGQGIHISPFLADRFHQQKVPAEAEVYIPAGRTLYSFLPPYALVSRVLASQEWPGYILTFYEILGNTINWLRKQQEQQNGKDSPDDDILETNFFKERIHSIFKGKIRYRDETVVLKIANGILSPANMAAGQMEIWPFWAIVEAGLRSKRFDSAKIYFEEPEAHLHPAAQRSIMEMIAFLAQKQTRFLITTHSPYILYSINNFLMAQKVLNAGQMLPSGIPETIALTPDKIAAYRFSTDGTVHDIMDREIGLIDEDELDRVAYVLGSDFSALQDCLEEAE